MVLLFISRGALVDDLGYQAPMLMRQAVARALGEEHGDYNILDIGCGTGLCGEEINHLAGKLVGVDLSAKMVEVARKKGIYNSLHVADVVDFMRAEPGRYDVVLAGDVFIYIGNLSPVFEACGLLLGQGGLFSFSLEAAEGPEDYCLRSTNRYAHSQTYIDRLIGQFQMDLVSCDKVVLRQQKGEPVAGYIYLLRKN